MRARAARSRTASTRAGSWVETSTVRSPRSSASWASSSSAPASSSAVYGSSRTSKPRIVEQDAAEREPLRHPARVRRDPVAPRVPEAEALEQHPDPLAPLGHAVQPAVEVEVLERGELAIDERLVPEVAELAARDAALDRPLRRRGKAGADPQERRLARTVRPGDDEEAAVRQVEIDAAQDAFLSVPLAELRSRQHALRIGPAAFYETFTAP